MISTRLMLFIGARVVVWGRAPEAHQVSVSGQQLGGVQALQESVVQLLLLLQRQAEGHGAV